MAYLNKSGSPAVAYLVHHGATEDDMVNPPRMSGDSSIPLNQEGEEQAHEAGKTMDEYPHGPVYSSDLVRARQTAREISPRVKLDHRLRPEDGKSAHTKDRTQFDSALDEYKDKNVPPVLVTHSWNVARVTGRKQNDIKPGEVHSLHSDGSTCQLC